MQVRLDGDTVTVVVVDTKGREERIVTDPALAEAILADARRQAWFAEGRIEGDTARGNILTSPERRVK